MAAQKQRARRSGKSDDGGRRGPVRQPDDYVIRVFTLCDFAENVNTKLFLGGAGVSKSFVPTLPWPLAPSWLAARIRIPPRYRDETLRVKVRLLYPDGEPTDHDPLQEMVSDPSSRVNVEEDAEELNLQFILQMTNYPIRREGLHYFVLEINDRIVGIAPLKIAIFPAPQAGQNAEV